MASFKTHFSFGLVLGIVSVFSIISLALLPIELNYFIFIFLTAVIGAVMPDLDSDTSIPFHIAFGSFALLAGALTCFYMMKAVPGDYLMNGAYTLGAIFTVWIVIGSIFKKFTVHRGMAHSIPAAVLAGLAVFTVAARTDFDQWSSFLLGFSFFLGYMIHLILDEIWAAVNFHGTPFVPNKTLGSALKFFSKSSPVNVFVYLAIMFLLMENGQILYGFTIKLLQLI